jgi:ribosomal protein S27AE
MSEFLREFIIGKIDYFMILPEKVIFSNKKCSNLNIVFLNFHTVTEKGYTMFSKKVFLMVF